ncbi:GntR family transcriptional regulator [Bordetella parapertussis]|uniref:GntR-family transcriptional regulator n=1 Tax=Bordetella parapertussis (strain Bpp5) TaxID=1208660 RepID=K0MJK5_BORPB|nr:GntR family transcriptional regulator [Bordetella parapertussis]CCJ51064.1 putative GntR-family transcriptional regulator [Bordetella parapertussis Bpp5]
MKVSDRIRIDIERQLQDGTLLPGDPVDDGKLAAQHNVSRTPVREALLQLQAQGLLTSLPRGGMVVAKMDVQQLLSMWELLAELESLCARYACERMTDEERAVLRQLHEEAAPIVETNDEVGWQEMNLAFHEALYKGSRNPYLRQEILRMRTQTGAYRRHAFGAVGRIPTSYGHHQLVLDAVLANQPAQAAKAIFEHMSPGHGTRGVADMIVNMPRSLLS